jgi:hypothetical protein
VQAADDTQRDGAVESVGMAQSNGPVTRLKGIGITKGRRLQLLRRRGQPNNSKISHRIAAHHLAIDLSSVGKADLNPVSSLDHVSIGQHQSIATDDHP